MLNKFCLFLTLCISTLCTGQIKGTLYDSTNKKPVPLVNIWVIGKDNGATANEKGEFVLTKTDSTDRVLFSAVGYADKQLKVTEITSAVFLDRDTIRLQEVVIAARRNRHTRIINPVEDIDETHFSASSPSASPILVARLIPYKQEYEKTPFIKELLFYTHSDKKNTLYHIRLYDVGENGGPGALLHDETLTGIAPKGKEMSYVDVSRLNIRMPEKGFYVAVEWLLIERNEFLIYTVGSKKGQVYYNPRFVNTYTPRKEGKWIYKSGKWEYSGQFNNKYYNMAVEVTLTD